MIRMRDMHSAVYDREMQAEYDAVCIENSRGEKKYLLVSYEPVQDSLMNVIDDFPDGRIHTETRRRDVVSTTIITEEQYRRFMHAREEYTRKVQWIIEEAQ